MGGGGTCLLARGALPGSAAVVVGGGVTGLLARGALPVDVFGPWGEISTGLCPPANADRAGGGARF